MIARRKRNFFAIEYLLFETDQFHTYALLLAFFEFLGPSVNSLQYWGGKSMSKKKKTYKTKPNKSTVFDTD